jgi:hypothetical protein
VIAGYAASPIIRAGGAFFSHIIYWINCDRRVIYGIHAVVSVRGYLDTVRNRQTPQRPNYSRDSPSSRHAREYMDHYSSLK